jgi:hypothetical protein
MLFFAVTSSDFVTVIIAVTAVEITVKASLQVKMRKRIKSS